MLQIDDAGWGCLIGGVVIGCYRIPESPDEHGWPCFVSGVISPRHFQNDDPEEPNRYARRRYLPAATEVIATCFARLKATPAEPVQIAPGPVLDGVQGWLSEAGYRWEAGRITGACHAQLAQAWQLHLAALGFSAGMDLLTNPARAGLFWWRQVQWLKGRGRPGGGPGPGTRPGLQDGLDRVSDLGLSPLQPGAGAGRARAAAKSARTGGRMMRNPAEDSADAES